MARIPLDIPAGIQGNDTTYAAQGRWADGSNVRFFQGRAQTIGGWESLTTTLLTGVCRAAFPFTDNANNLTVGFGTHSNLQLWQGGDLYDITPTLALPAKTLAIDPLTQLEPLAVANGSPTVTVNQPGHGLTASDTIIVSGAVVVGGIAPNGTFPVASVVDDDHYTYTFTSNASLTHTLGANPLSVVLSSPVVTVTQAAHNIADGSIVTFSGATAVGGITPNGTFPITVINANSYSFQFTAVASSTATGGGSAVVVTLPSTGGGTAVVVAPQRAYAAGQIDGTGSAGFGTGAYGVGDYGLPSTADYFPRTWSFGAWGENMLASPRGGTIYAWENNPEVVAAPLDNAPRQVSYMLVAPNSGGYQVFAIGCNQEADGVFNPMCIRHSSVRNNTEWTTDLGTTAREYVLTGGGRLVAGRMCGPYILAWTNDSLFVGEFLGDTNQPWSFTRVAKNCGLLGPNAAAVIGQQAFWVSPDLQFWSYTLGGQPQVVACQVREDFADNLAAAQGDKVVASTNAKFSEVRFDYPDQRDGSGYENSRFIALCVAGSDAGAWHKGQMARTAFVDAGPSQYPIAATYEGAVYFHEKGNSADGAAFAWFLTSADCYLDENYVMEVNGLWPDIFHQQGPVFFESFARFYPQDVEASTGAMTFGIGTQKVDLRQSGRLFRFQFSGNSGPTYARLGKFDVDVVKRGLR